MVSLNMYKCVKCDFSTDNKQTYKKHVARKRPCVVLAAVNGVHEHPYECGKCGMGYVHEARKNTHEATCEGVHPLQCGKCKTFFKNRFAKSRHLQDGGCKAQDTLNTVNDMSVNNVNNVNNVVNNSGNVGNIVNGNVVNNNTIVINCTPEQKNEIVSFLDTDLDAVVELITKDPTRFQLAMATGSLNQELCKATHFDSIAKNRNVYGSEAKGTKMHVHQNGRKLSMDKKQGLDRILANNHKIVNDDKASQYIDPSFLARTFKERKLIGDVVQNKGDYVPTQDFHAMAPDFDPPPKDLEALVEDMGEALFNYWHLQEELPVTELIKKAYAHRLCHYKTRWFHFLDTGVWSLCVVTTITIRECLKELLELVTDAANAGQRVTPERDLRYSRHHDILEGIKELKADRLIARIIEKAKPPARSLTGL